MDIYEFAMKMEKDGENFYRDLSAKTNNKGLKSIFTLLAEDEVKHFQILSELREKQNSSMTDTHILKDAKNIFEDLKESGLALNPDLNQAEAYKTALSIEKESEAFYLEKAEEVSNSSHKDMLVRIAEEEKKHIFLLENIIEFISRPQQWIEDAEFNHLIEY